MNESVTIKKSSLEMALSKLHVPENYNISLEQYNTSPSLASALLFRAAQEGNVIGRKVADLGCGNGIFAVGAALLGARKVYGIDKDKKILDSASKNAEMMGIQIELINSDVSEFNVKVDTVIMNPPFGVHKRGLDMPFIQKAIELSKHFYIILDYNAGDFLSKLIRPVGTVVWEEKSFIEIPRLYKFHTKEKIPIPVRIARVDLA
ncbi:MAG: METTL5 family protein [Thermoplasmatales archaeon]